MAPLYAHLACSRRCEVTFIWSAPNRYAFCTSLAAIALSSELTGFDSVQEQLGRDYRDQAGDFGASLWSEPHNVGVGELQQLPTVASGL